MADLTDDAIREHLEQVLHSPTFINAPRLSGFLTYIVKETLAGRADAIKEYSIGLTVFGKDADYDPKLDSTVRTEASKLRARLAQHYERVASDIVISVPRGGYVPKFNRSGPVPESNAPSGRRPIRARVAIIASALALGAVATAAVLIRQSLPPIGSAPGLSRRLQNRRGVLGPRFSPDGQRLTFICEDDRQKSQVCVTDLPGGQTAFVTSGQAHWGPAWSPDGRTIAAIRDPWVQPEIVLYSLYGGGVRVVGRAQATWISWMPNGKELLVAEKLAVDRSAIFLVEPSSGARRQVTFPPPTGDGDIAATPSPDGRSIAFVRSDSVAGGDVWVTSLDGSRLRRLTRVHNWIYGVDWLDSDTLVFASRHTGQRRLYTINTSGRQAEPPAFEGVVTDAVYPTVYRGASGATSRLAFENWSGDRNIWSWERTAGTARPPSPLIASTSADLAPDFSPDGARIAFCSSRSGILQLWVAERDGANAQQLTRMPVPSGFNPRWSPDGRHIAFDAGASQNDHDLYVMDAAGGSPRLLAPGAHAAWSRDGAWVYFAARDGRWKIRPAGGQALRVLLPPVFEIEESFDGRSLFYTKGHDQKGLWSRPSGGGEERLVADTVSPLLWAIGRSGLFFLKLIDGSRDAGLYYQNLSSGRTTKLADISGNFVHRLAVSPDERVFAFGQLDADFTDIYWVDGWENRRGQ